MTSLFKRTGFVGAYLPPPLVDYLRLISVQRGQSLQRTLEDLVINQRNQESEEDILTKLIDQAVNEWYSQIDQGSLSGGREEQKAFMMGIEDKLRKKKISPIHIKALLPQIKGKIKKRRITHDEKNEERA